jgi:hypothetical protein
MSDAPPRRPFHRDPGRRPTRSRTTWPAAMVASPMVRERASPALVVRPVLRRTPGRRDHSPGRVTGGLRGRASFRLIYRGSDRNGLVRRTESMRLVESMCARLRVHGAACGAVYPQVESTRPSSRVRQRIGTRPVSVRRRRFVARDSRGRFRGCSGRAGGRVPRCRRAWRCGRPRGSRGRSGRLVALVRRAGRLGR